MVALDIEHMCHVYSLVKHKTLKWVVVASMWTSIILDKITELCLHTVTRWTFVSYAFGTIFHCRVITYIFNKLFTHSLKGFSVYVKKDFIKNYIFVCTNENCYVCIQ